MDELLGVVIGAAVHVAAAGVVASATNEQSKKARRRKEKQNRKQATQAKYKSYNVDTTTLEDRINRMPKPVKEKRVMKTNLFSNDLFEPRQVQLPPGQAYDPSKLRGNLIHNPVSKDWKYQPTFIVHSGFMSKTGEYNTAFKLRFFVLTSKRELRYYKCSPSEVDKIAQGERLLKRASAYEKGVILLSDFQSIDVRSKTEFRLRNFDSVGRDYIFQCSNPADARAWNLILRATCAGCSDPQSAIKTSALSSMHTPTDGITSGRASIDEDIDDIDPIVPELIGETPHDGPGYSPLPEPSAPNGRYIIEQISQCHDIAPSAPPQETAGEFGEPGSTQVEGLQTGK